MKVKKKGFTLIELIAVMFIGTILGSLIISLYLSSNRMLVTSSTESILQDEGRIVLDAIENDLKVAKKDTIKKLPSGDFGVTFQDSSGKIFSYVADLGNKKLSKTKDNPGVEIATPTSNLETFELSKVDNQYKLKIKLKKGEVEEEFISMITPRNSQGSL